MIPITHDYEPYFGWCDVDGCENEERFFPCNGTEGVSFMDDFCEHCIHEKWVHTQQSGDK